MTSPGTETRHFGLPILGVGRASYVALMAKHQLFVDLNVQDMEVKKKDVVFKVYQDGKKFGELRLSQGAVVWRGRNDKDGRKMRWTRFDQFMQDEARRAERRPPGSRITVRKHKRKGP